MPFVYLSKTITFPWVSVNLNHMLARYNKNKVSLKYLSIMLGVYSPCDIFMVILG